VEKLSAPGPERRDAHAGPAGEAAVGGGHEGGGLLVAGEDELDRGGAQGLDRVEVLLARHPEDALHALPLQSRHQKIRTLGHHTLLKDPHTARSDHFGKP
jgi:hypothetical protein